MSVLQDHRKAGRKKRELTDATQPYATYPLVSRVRIGYRGRGVAYWIGFGRFLRF
jgi:hypothetical protein